MRCTGLKPALVSTCASSPPSRTRTSCRWTPWTPPSAGTTATAARVNNMKIGSLFSGYGGLDIAVQNIFPGSEIAWHCEFDEAPSRILQHHYPHIPNIGDV